MDEVISPHKKPDRRILPAYVALALVLFGVYVYVYQFAPFETSVNDTITYSVTSISAFLTALSTTVIYLHHQPEDSPRNVWRNMMIGCWLWFGAEGIWQIIFTLQSEVTTPNLSDILWTAGFIFFTIAFIHQYLLIFPSYKTRVYVIAAGAWAVSLVAPYIYLSSINAFSISDYINFFYPVADLALGIAGIALVYVFQGGALTRPWIGLVVFSVSDLLYAWAEQTGVYTWSVENGSLLTLAIDSIYIAAYLIMTFGFLAHWMLITYGLRDSKK